MGEETCIGGLADLGDYLRLPLVLPARGSTPVHVTVTLPVEADNTVMTDRVTFAIHLARQQVLPPPDVLGEEETAAGGGQNGGPDEPIVLGVGAYAGPTSVDAGLGFLDDVVPVPATDGVAVRSLIELSAVIVLLTLALGAARRARRQVAPSGP